MKKITKILSVFSVSLMLAAGMVACASSKDAEETSDEVVAATNEAATETQAVADETKATVKKVDEAVNGKPAKSNVREEVLDQAQVLIDQGKYDEAVNTLNKHESDLKSMLSDAKKKQAAAKAAAERDDKIALAKKYIADEKYDQAISVLNQVLRADPNDQEAKELLAEARQKKAAAEARAAHDRKIAQARSLIDQGKYDEAISILNGLLRDDPYDTEAQDLLEEAQKKKAAAATEKERAAKKAQAARLISQGKYDEAIALLDEVLAEDPYDTEAQDLRDQAEAAKAAALEKANAAKRAQARKLIDQGKYDEAIDLLNEILAENPADTEAQALLDEAEAAKAAEQEAKERADKIALAKRYIDQGKYQEAIDILDELLEKKKYGSTYNYKEDYSSADAK